MSFSIITAGPFRSKIVDCTGSEVIPPGGTNIDGGGDNSFGEWEVAIQQDQGHPIDMTGFNVTITSALGAPTSVVSNGAFVAPWSSSSPNFVGLIDAGAGTATCAFHHVFLTSQSVPPLVAYMTGITSTTNALWHTGESVTLHVECTSTAAGESFSHDFTFTVGDKVSPKIIASVPSDSATNVPVNQVTTISIRDDSFGTGVDPTNLQLYCSNLFGNELVYDGSTGMFSATYSGNGPPTITAAGNGFDFANIQRTPPFSTSDIVSYQFPTLQDVLNVGLGYANPVNQASSGTGSQEFTFTTVSAGGISYVLTPTAGSNISPSFGNDVSGTPYVTNLITSSSGLGQPIVQTLTGRINSNPTFSIYDVTGGGTGWQTGWTGTQTFVAADMTSLYFYPTASYGVLIGDTLVFEITTTAGSDTETFDWDYAVANPITVTPTPANLATDIAPSAIYQLRYQCSDSQQNITIDSVTVQAGAGSPQLAYNGSFHSPYNGPGSGVVTNVFGGSDKTLFLQAVPGFDPTTTYTVVTNAHISPAGPSVTLTATFTTLTISVSPSIVPNDGGYALSLTFGHFNTVVPDGTYHVYCGLTGTTQDALCYSGVSGQGSVVIAKSGLLKFVSPVLPIDTGYSFTVQSTDKRILVSTGPLLQTSAHEFHGEEFRLKKSLSPRYYLGPRNLIDVKYPQK